MEVIKKYWYILLLVIVLIVSTVLYFTSKEQLETPEEINQNNQNNENKELLAYAENYFNNYVNVLGIDEYNVTIQMLKDATKLELALYDMEKLEKCENESYATIKVKPYETTIEKIDSHFICK